MTSNLLKNNEKLMTEYNFDKNNNLNLDALTLGSDKKIWWICKNKHEWEASIGSRYRTGCGCPYCSNKKVLEGYNDLTTTNPSIAKEWNFKRNSLLPTEIQSGSNKKVWWICPKGHEYEASVVNRTKLNGTGCPYCSNQKILKGYNDLATLRPELLKEWNYKKNIISPSEIGVNSSKKIWWICSNGHEWQAVVYSRLSGTSCPYCNNRKVMKGYNELKSKYPYIAKEWDYNKNGDLTPSDVFGGSNKKIWWICPKGHSYQQTPNNRISGHGCPVCIKERVTSFQEKIVYYYIKKYFPDSKDNYKLKNYGKRELDIFIPSIKVAIEYDGGYYHTSTKSDIEKDKLCEMLGIKLYRIRDIKCSKINSTSICFYRKDKTDKDLEQIIFKILNDLNVQNIKVNIESDIEDIYSKLDFMEKEKSLSIIKPELLKEWNYNKNGKLTPESISPSSSKKVWWICSKGHEWQTSPNKRSNGSGCPYCSNNKILKGYNDLETTCPKLVKEWNYKRNNLSPSEVMSGSNKKVWWVCPKGHEYEASILNRTKNNGTKCPICCNQKVLKGYNDLETLNPNLAVEFDVSKNNGKTASDFVLNSGKKVWWKCKNCNFEWEATIVSRNHGYHKCPKCKN